VAESCKEGQGPKKGCFSNDICHFIPENSILKKRYGDFYPDVLKPITKRNLNTINPKLMKMEINVCICIYVCVYIALLVLKPKNVNELVPLCMCVERHVKLHI
jgi:hypothetical protein